MPQINTVTLLGNITEAPELKKTQAGNVAIFTVAVNYKDKDKKEHGEFFPIEVWGGWALNLCKTAKKGSLVLVQGRLRQDAWKDKEGENRSRVVVRASSVYHLEATYSAKPESPETVEEEGTPQPVVV